METNDEIYKLVKSVLKGDSNISGEINKELEDCVKMGYKIAEELDQKEIHKDEFIKIHKRLDDIMKQITSISEKVNMLTDKLVIKKPQIQNPDTSVPFDENNYTQYL